MKYSSYSFPLAQYSPTRYSSYTPSSTYTPSAVSSYSAATHYTPTSHLTSSHYTPTHYSSSSTASKYLPSSYSSSYTPSLYTPVAHKSLSSYTSLSSYVKPPRYTSAREASAETRQTARRASSTRATEARQTSARRTSIKSTAAPTSVAADDNATAITGADPDSTATDPDATATDPDASPQVVVKPVRNVRFPNDIIFQDFVRHGDLEQIGRFMRARKVRLDKFFLSGMAALHEAVLSGNLECVKLLVFYGADVHQRDEDGWTPLHMACSDSFPEIAKYLISKGAGTKAANANGDRPADLIDPECKELVEMFKVGCI
ncbi:DNA-directed RNA polymerase II subunit RPB1-like [Alosa sapidissima]|uniref:DNA-directed RNA polymerase II subunit RPB1-like n=1 Tax=Alosa sapidissima TaxID=34773 RepID=UPI001C0A5299|nr:DNA-directed RNA polymerase II subunit RPB1-like [Alosa sapidissima]